MEKIDEIEMKNIFRSLAKILNIDVLFVFKNDEEYIIIENKEFLLKDNSPQNIKRLQNWIDEITMKKKNK